jgi:lipid-binding SYLF domain-containing protein
MKKTRQLLTATLLAISIGASTARANPQQEIKTMELAADTVRALADMPGRGLPQAVLRDAAGVAILPHIVKAGVVFDERFGHGVVLVREPNGQWSHPVFVTLSGHGIGLQAGVEATDLVLVFKTRRSLERALNGKLVLGTDVNIAAGPVGREVEKASDNRLMRAEIYTYSRSRGLFAGVSLEGSIVHIDARANDAFYNMRGCRAEEVLSRHGAGHPVVELLRSELIRLGGAPPAANGPPRGR